MWCAHKDCWWASAKKEQQFWVRENGLARMIISTRSLRNCKYVNALGNRQMNRLLIVHLLVFTLCLLLYINMHENWSWNVTKYFTHSIEVPKLTHVLVQYMYVFEYLPYSKSTVTRRPDICHTYNHPTLSPVNQSFTVEYSCKSLWVLLSPFLLWPDASSVILCGEDEFHLQFLQVDWVLRWWSR